MEEKKEFIGRDQTMIDLAKDLSKISKNAGTVGFTIRYSATSGNLKVHEAFQKYAFEEANNEYLLAIDKLLKNAEFIDYFKVLDERVTRLENAALLVEEKSNDDESVDKESKEDRKFF